MWKMKEKEKIMAVKQSIGGTLLLEIDKGDFIVFSAIMKKWKFKDYQSLLRFVEGCMLRTERSILCIDINKNPESAFPGENLLISEKIEEEGNNDCAKKKAKKKNAENFLKNMLLRHRYLYIFLLCVVCKIYLKLCN
jgi:hypothetical protein